MLEEEKVENSECKKCKRHEQTYYRWENVGLGRYQWSNIDTLKKNQFTKSMPIRISYTLLSHGWRDSTWTPRSKLTSYEKISSFRRHNFDDRIHHRRDRPRINERACEI